MSKINVNRIASEITLFFLFILTSILLKLRYRIVLENEQVISPQAKQQGGILFLPNHSSVMDGTMIYDILYKYRAHPIVIDFHFFSWDRSWVFSLIEAICIPNFNSGTNDFKEQELNQTKEQIAQYLSEGKNVIIFPSGLIKLSAKEVIGGSSLVPEIIQKSKPREIVLMRLSGMWGSSFSLGYDGKYPIFEKGWGKRCLTVLKNLIFFMPKRNVHIHFEKVSFKPNEDLISINHKLEDFYNAPYPEGEPLSRVPYYFWKEGKFPTQKIPSHKRSINQAFADKIITEIAELFSLSKADLSLETRFGLDLGMDSLDLARLASYFESKYDLGATSLDQFWRISDVVRWVEDNNGFEKPFTLKEIYLPKGIQTPNKIVCGDLWSAPLSHHEFNNLVSSLSKQCAPILSQQIGLLMLNSVESMALIRALFSLGKVPVLIDWLKGLNYKEQIHQHFPSLPIITTRFVINTFNFVEIDGLSQQFFWLNEARVLRRFKGELKPPLKNHFLQYFAKEGDEVKMKSFSKESYTQMANKMQTLGIDGRVALIHPFTGPKEVAANLICLDLGYETFFLSSYRTSTKEISIFLNSWKIPYALCDPFTYERLKKIQDSKTQIYLLSDLYESHV